MKRLLNVLSIVSLMACACTASAQYDYLEIKLEIARFTKAYNHFELSLYSRSSLDSTDRVYYLAVKSLSDSPENGIADTVYSIDKSSFDRIAQLSSNISSEALLRGMDLANPPVFNDGIGCALSLNVFQQSVKYEVLNPMAETKERNLTTYLDVCQELLRLAKLSPNKILK